MKAAIVKEPGKTPVYGEFAEPAPQPGLAPNRGPRGLTTAGKGTFPPSPGRTE